MIESSLSILYILLVHQDQIFIEKLLQRLNESQHTFILHVDVKYSSLHASLSDYSLTKSNVHILQEGRENISWGGYSIVNATLNCMKYAWISGISFDYLVYLSGSTYPIKSNSFIRKTLSRNVNTIYMDIDPIPNKPSPEVSLLL